MNKKNLHLRPTKISRRGFLGLSGVAAAGLITACKPFAPPPEFPNDSWRTSPPEAQGIDSQKIAAMLEQIQQASPYFHSFLLLRNGVLVTEAYFAPITRDLPHFLFSATKSVTSALVGIAIQEGFIRGVEQKLIDIFPEMQAKKTSDHLGQLTVEHLLTMSTGHVAAMSPTPYQPPPVDWVEKFLADKTNTLIDEPGSVFLYTSGAAHTLSAVIQKTTGRTTAGYAAEKLFRPIGIKNFTWLPDQNGISFGNSWLRLKPLDMARFGYLYLNKGSWNGKQVIPKAWVEQSTKKHIETKEAMFNSAEKAGYGYLWWMSDFGGYAAHGYGGQFIFVVPETSLVAVFTGGFNDSLFDTAHRLMKDFVVPAVQKTGAALPRNEPAYQGLAAMVDQAGSPPGKAVPPLPAVAGRISGKTFLFDNGMRMVAIFDGTAEYTLRLSYPASGQAAASGGAPASGGVPTAVLEFHGGLDGIYRLNQGVDRVLGTFTLGVKGYWQDETTFVHLEYPTDNVSSNIITCHFSGDRLTLDITDDFSGSSTNHTSMEAVLVN